MPSWRHPILLLLLLSGIGSAACQTAGTVGGAPTEAPAAATGADVQTQQRSVAGFDRVHVSGIGLLVVTPGTPEALSIEAEPDVLSQIRSEVEDRTLEIGPVPGANLDAHHPIVYHLRASGLRELQLSGAVSIQATGLRADDLTLDVDGSGRATLTDLQASNLTVTLSGSAEMTATGTVPRQQITVMGASHYQGQGLHSQQATVLLTGAGLCELRVSDRLDVDVMGAGRVSYLGSPSVHESITGTGLVVRAG